MNIEFEDLKLAWIRTKDDLSKSIFIEHPHELQIIKENEEGWLESVNYELKTDTYYPDKAIVIDIPKQNGSVRPGSYLSIKDHLVYTYLIGSNLTQIRSELSWSSKKYVFSHAIQNVEGSKTLVEDHFTSWEEFRNQSLIATEDVKTNYVLFADITAFYENISIKELASNLLSISLPTDHIQLLKKCLNIWNGNSDKGLPQGFRASDILSNIYLNFVDYNLKQNGYRFLRYGDDYRIFCKNILESRKAQLDLIRELRLKGLNLQNEKTKTLNKNDSKNKIDDVNPIIESVKKNLTIKENDEETQELYWKYGYFDGWDSFTEVEEEDPEPNDEQMDDIMWITLKTYFIDSYRPFNKTLFRYCLGQLAANKNPVAIDHCIKLLVEHPEETRPILKYLTVFSLETTSYDDIYNYIVSDLSIYDYQKYEIIRWINLTSNTETKLTFLTIAKKIAFNKNKPFYLRAVCRSLIGCVGKNVEIELLKNQYEDTMNALEKCEILCCLKRLEKNKRNSFYGLINTQFQPISKEPKVIYNTNSILINGAITLSKQ